MLTNGREQDGRGHRFVLTGFTFPDDRAFSGSQVFLNRAQQVKDRDQRLFDALGRLHPDLSFGWAA
jgi:hypothetical protein